MFYVIEIQSTESSASNLERDEHDQVPEKGVSKWM